MYTLDSPKELTILSAEEQKYEYVTEGAPIKIGTIIET